MHKSAPTKAAAPGEQTHLLIILESKEATTHYFPEIILTGKDTLDS